ncbi:Ger(x)C family spore germination protein [Clostridium sp. MSJ-11]|uniref:Ger(X)C family spore germination protein n=1 Tax=Clostridium mobile TaxID=2841512 RepID=A0ABS6EJ93_9CLOT|nr:Ger(x)C family spore germination protein [Clostridium mobile]MBU5485309.1 Ger(x)C family spore germination protein [Clostridium mobile]
MNRKKIIIVVLIISTIFLAYGCIGKMELSEYGIVTMIGHDIKDEKVKLNFEVIEPSNKKDKSNGKPSIFTQVEGRTVFEAIRNTTLIFDRKLYFSHSKILMFSEEMARDGILKYLDFWNRDYEVNLGGYILVVKADKSENLFVEPKGVERLLSNHIEYLIKNSKYNGKSTVVKLRDLVKQYYSEGSQVYVTGVISAGSNNVKNSSKNYNSLNIEGLAIFIKDKLAGYLDGIETMGYNFIKNNIKSGAIVSPSEEEYKFYTVKIIDSNAKNSVFIEDDSLRINVDVEVSGMMNEIMTGENLREVNTMEKIEKLTEDSIKKIIEKTIKRSQEDFKTDIFDFYKYAYRYNYSDWVKVKDRWNELYANGDVKVNVKVKLEKEALLDDSFMRRETR